MSRSSYLGGHTVVPRSELNGTDLRRGPIKVRKATLASILRKSRHGVRLNEHLVRLNEHLEHDCRLTVFQHACKMGLEGIVSKRLETRYQSGRSSDWLKFKNPKAPAVGREQEEEDWGFHSRLCGRQSTLVTYTQLGHS